MDQVRLSLFPPPRTPSDPIRSFLSDLGWCQALSGKHYARIGAIHLGAELQSRSGASCRCQSKVP